MERPRGGRLPLRRPQADGRRRLQGQVARLPRHALLLRPLGARPRNRRHLRYERLPLVRECPERLAHHQPPAAAQGQLRGGQPDSGRLPLAGPSGHRGAAHQRRRALRGIETVGPLLRRPESGQAARPGQERPLPGAQPQIFARRAAAAAPLALADRHPPLVHRDGPVPLPGVLRLDAAAR